jgi:arylformamidase
MNKRSRYFDLSHTIEEGMITYQGIPGPELSDFMSREASRQNYAEGTEFHVGRIDMVANTGTYLDTPFHRYRYGSDLSGIRLEDVAGIPGIMISVPYHEKREITVSCLPAGSELKGAALLIHTGFSNYWNSPDYFKGHHPFLTREAAGYLVSHKVKMVGIDSYNIDDTADLSRPAHSLLLGAGIYIIEHMTGLHELPVSGFRFFAVPQKIRGLGSFPVRAFAIV